MTEIIAVELPAETDRTKDPVEEGYKILLHKMAMTKGARYQAARRHGKRSNASIWSIIFLSMYVFVVTVVVALDGHNIPVLLTDLMNILVISMSAFIIAFSALEHGKKHDLKAEQFLRNAQGIAKIHDSMKIDLELGRCTADNLVQCTDEYAALVHDFPDNHSEADYRTFRVNIGKHRDQPFYEFRQKLFYSLECWVHAWASLLLPPIIVLAGYFIILHFGK